MNVLFCFGFISISELEGIKDTLEKLCIWLDKIQGKKGNQIQTWPPVSPCASLLCNF